MEAFQEGFRAKCAIIACILNLEYPLLMFLLLAVYHLFIRHCIVKDRVGKNNVWNLGHGENVHIFWLQGRGVIELGKKFASRGLKVWRTLLSNFVNIFDYYLFSGWVSTCNLLYFKITSQLFLGKAKHVQINHHNRRYF